MGVYPMGVHLTGVHPMDIHLNSVYLMGVHFIGRAYQVGMGKVSWDESCGPGGLGKLS